MSPTFVFRFPLSGDVVATLSISGELEPDDVETLASNLVSTNKVLLKAVLAAPTLEPAP